MKKSTLLVFCLFVLFVSCVAQTPQELYELIPGRYPDALSLPDVLASLPQTKEGREIILRVIDELQNATGLILPPNIVYEALNDSSVLLNYSKVSIREIADAWSGANLAYWAGKIAQVNDTNPRVTSPFHYPEDIFTTPLNISNWIPSLEPIGDNYLWGFPFKNETGLKQARINTVMSFVFNQLAANIHLTPNDPKMFVVEYLNKTFTTVDDFLFGLMSMGGYEVNTYLEWHIAQFFGLYTRDNKTGVLSSAADPVMQTTGIWNANKTKEVILPAAHSQWMITVNNSEMSFSLIWFQGDTLFAFYASEIYIITAWSGRRTAWNMYGKDAVTAIKYMSFVQDTFIEASRKENLYDFGYGVTGVCDDSCGIVELMLFNETKMYPFLIEKQLVLPEIMTRIKAYDSNQQLYFNMLRAVNALPVDWQGVNPTSVTRAAESIVWPAGREPWQCVVDARQILSELGGEPVNKILNRF